MNPTRRRLLMAGLSLAPPLLPQPPKKSLYACVGCYTTRERNARGDGIHVYRVNPESGAWSHAQHIGGLVNPSFLITGPNPRYVYASHGDENYATAFAVDPASGHLTRLNQAATGGGNGAHLAIDQRGRFIVVANYASGTVAVLPVRQDGSLADHIQLVKLEGQPGPHKTEQISSHPHHVVFDPSGRFVIVPDKGLDRVFVFRFDPASGKLTPAGQPSVASRPGYAPRHAAFHPTLPVVWVVNEISSMVTTYAWDAREGGLRPLQILPSLPQDFTGRNSLAEIVASGGGRFVYCSNRGHDSIAIFTADPKTGLLSPAGWMPTRGKTPRFIGLDPSHRFMYSTNEQSDTITSWRVDAATGKLSPTDQVIQNASPVTIAWL
jgi:6-phosphogluconolactonase (cycloisomerase 2 family)